MVPPIILMIPAAAATPIAASVAFSTYEEKVRPSTRSAGIPAVDPNVHASGSALPANAMTAPAADTSPLARFGGERPPASAWFESAVARKPQSRFVTVEGAAIHYLHWEARHKPGLLFVHGNAAHAHWWSFIAPFFADAVSVIASACDDFVPPG